MTDKQLLEFQSIVKRKNFDWEKFSFGKLTPYDKAELRTRIYYKGTDYYFEYTFNELTVGLEVGGWTAKFSPADNFEPVSGILNRHSFNQVLNDFEIWLIKLIEELKARDFLSSLGKINTGISNFFDSSFGKDEYFNETEIIAITDGINKFREEIKPFVDDDGFKIINEKLDYLIEKTNYPKVDWFNILISNVIQLSITGTIYVISNLDYIIALKNFVKLIFSLFQISIE